MIALLHRYDVYILFLKKPKRQWWENRRKNGRFTPSLNAPSTVGEVTITGLKLEDHVTFWWVLITVCCDLVGRRVGGGD